MTTAVAISTTGDEHRMPLLSQCVRHWDAALGPGDSLFVTVDGDESACERVLDAVREVTGSVFRVGQPQVVFPSLETGYGAHVVREGRLGVAVSKNTGLELMMDSARPTPEHLFLSDDDTWPLGTTALNLHRDLGEPHSMVCWGKHRLASQANGGPAQWTWPRGVVLYQTRAVVEQVGGLVEAFGPGGHEHVEYSRRIYQHGLTAVQFGSPGLYASRGGAGAAAVWHAEDMRRAREPLGNHRLRRKRLTSVRREAGDWDRIEKLMASLDEDTTFVPYKAHDNGRSSATLYPTP